MIARLLAPIRRVITTLTCLRLLAPIRWVITTLTCLVFGHWGIHRLGPSGRWSFRCLRCGYEYREREWPSVSAELIARVVAGSTKAGGRDD